MAKLYGSEDRKIDTGCTLNYGPHVSVLNVAVDGTLDVWNIVTLSLSKSFVLEHVPKRSAGGFGIKIYFNAIKRPNETLLLDV